MNLLRQMRGGKVYDPDFNTRMKGSGIFAELIRQRFQKACAKAGLNASRRAHFALNNADFCRPRQAAARQGELF